MNNFYCNGVWFNTYKEACEYSNDLLKQSFIHKVVFTKAEMDSITNAIDHEMECGK